MDGSEAKTGALTQLLRSEKRLEDVIERERVHAGARVGNGHGGVIAGARERLVGAVFRVEGRVAGLDDERAAVGHGIARIDAKVHQHLFDLSGVGTNEE